MLSARCCHAVSQVLSDCRQVLMRDTDRSIWRALTLDRHQRPAVSNGGTSAPTTSCNAPPPEALGRGPRVQKGPGTPAASVRLEQDGPDTIVAQYRMQRGVVEVVYCRVLEL
eukprot:1408725-Prymnesium_polylepis.2